MVCLVLVNHYPLVAGLPRKQLLPAGKFVLCREDLEMAFCTA